MLFGVVLGCSALAMLRKRHVEVSSPGGAGVFERRLNLSGSYEDKAQDHVIEYTARRPGLGLALMYIAGTASGLLGIGSGALKVPAMDLAMGLPIKVSTATSNFMIGVTAAASAGLYFTRGQIDPFIAAPVAVGVLAGAFAGSKTLGRIDSRTVRIIFVAVLVYVSLHMIYEGFSG
jgi:hypothetical protein